MGTQNGDIRGFPFDPLFSTSTFLHRKIDLKINMTETLGFNFDKSHPNYKLIVNPQRYFFSI